MVQEEKKRAKAWDEGILGILNESGETYYTIGSQVPRAFFLSFVGL